ncbi:MAG: alpha/beta hydrolase [Coprococcus sp.]|nr:alpha/beta hydrolase [Coprococcus sp.]
MKRKLKITTIFISISALIIHVINRMTCYLATIENIFNSSGNNYYDWRHGKIYYKKQGKGEPILLIHDLNSNSSGYEWKKIAIRLADKSTVYTIDLLGCGRSDKPNFTYTNYLYVQMINDFIKNVIGKKTNIIVTGDSVPIAIMACNTGENTIDKIVTINPISLKETTKIPCKYSKLFKTLIQTPIIGTLIYNTLHSKKQIENVFQNKYYYSPGRVDELIKKAYYEAAHSNHSHSKYLFASIKGKYTNMNIIPFISHIKNEILIISGDNRDYKITEEYLKYVPSIQTAIIKNTNYLPQLESPVELTNQVKVFFDI